MRGGYWRSGSWGVYVRPVPGQPAPARDELRPHCREHLAPYKTPLYLVFLDAFPLTPCYGTGPGAGGAPARGDRPGGGFATR
jgi:hypothetical protein